MGQNFTAKLADLIGGEEGYRLEVYQDIGGLWTVGRGHLIKNTDRVTRNGQSLALHPYGPVTKITPDEADAFFLRDTEAARNAVSNLVMVPLTDNQRAALVSLVFNIGAGAFGQSTLLRKLNVGDYKGAAAQFAVWKKVNGQDSAGLIARRARESSLFLS